LELPKAIIKQVDKLRKNCLWRGSDVNGRGMPKVAWKLVCKSKEQGGLGIINLEVQNQALLMKNLDKFYSRKDIPWVNMVREKHYSHDKLPGTVKKRSFWWRDVLKGLPKFKEMASSGECWFDLPVLEGQMGNRNFAEQIPTSILLCKG